MRDSKMLSLVYCGMFSVLSIEALRRSWVSWWNITTTRLHESTRGRRLRRDTDTSRRRRGRASGQRMFQLSLAQQRPCRSRPVKCLETAFEKRGRLGRSRALCMIRSFSSASFLIFPQIGRSLGLYSTVNTGGLFPTVSADEHRDLHKVKLNSH